MSIPSNYPYSDLSHDQVRQLIHAARIERSQAIRSFLASLFRWRRKASTWPHGTTAALSPVAR